MRVVVTTIPGLGHFHPMVPLLRSLAEAGHDVHLAVPGAFLPYVSSAGFAGTAVGPDWLESDIEAVVPGFLDLDSEEQHRAWLRLARRFAPDLEDFVTARGADVLIHDHAELAAWVVGERLGIPNVPFAMTARVLEPTSIRLMGMADDYDRFLVAAGLPAGATSGRATRWLYIDALPPGLTRSLLSTGPTVRHVRYASDDRGGGHEVPAWLARRGDARPLVYLTLGTIFNRRPELLATLARGAARLDVDVLVTVGPDRSTDLGPLPPNVRVERYVPQSLIYPALSAVICHGGFGTVFGALSHGIPLVCAPMSADQPLNAGLATGSGAAVNLARTPPEGRIFPALRPGEPSEAEVTEALSTVLTVPGHRDRARALAREIAAQPPPAEVAALVERVVATGAPITAETARR